MPKPLNLSRFNYSQLDSETSSLLRQETSLIKKLLSQTIENIVQIGLSLIKVKEHLQHGQYLDWLSEEFEMSISTADNFTRVAKCFNDANFSELDIAKSALYLLAAPSTPEKAREEALDMARQERVTKSMAIELIQMHKESESSVVNIPIPEPPPKINQSVKRRRLIESKEKRHEQNKLALKSQQVEKGEIWSLGRYHRLFCGDSSSLKFRKILPEEIALIIHFPELSNDWPRSIPKNAKSAIAFYTSLDDFHLETFRATVGSYVLGTADANESVVMIGLPDPSLFILLDSLECQCICAEPNPILCNDAVTAWTVTTKMQAKKV
jgi:hypothetical protein